MEDGLIACSCCGKMVIAQDIELAFRRPDAIAALTASELESRCKHDDDLCCLDGERYFVRGTIPLPIHEEEGTYEIGAWAEIGGVDFRKILTLWNDDEQAKELPFRGALANQVPTVDNSLGCSVSIRLTGAETRPLLYIDDVTCALFHEQSNGVQRHRASEYSDVVRNKGAQSKREFTLIEIDGVESSICSCCDSALHLYSGQFSGSADQKIRGGYWIEIPEGHDGSFVMMIAMPEGNSNRVAVLRGDASNEGLTYRVLDRDDSPWADLGEYGRIMDRKEALAQDVKATLFELVDLVAAKDSRLLAHTIPHLGLGK